MKLFNIVDYGAVGDGKVLNTDAFKKAVDACAENGGGTVVVPSGTYLTGSVELKSNITLFLESGGTIKASGNPDDFPYIGFHHNEMHETTSLIWALNSENITICGNGTIDINSGAYYGENTQKIYDDDTSEEAKQCYIYEKNEKRINQPIFFDTCSSVKIENLKIINSTCWTMTFSRSTDIVVDKVTVRNSIHVQNDDGIHLSACHNAMISNCNISCLDDCIAVTSITAHEQLNSHIVITNCVLSSRSSAIRLGHKISDVAISNITIYDNNRGIGIFTNPNCYIENVCISNIIMHNRYFPSVCWGKGEAVVIAAPQRTSHIKNVKLSNIIGTASNGILIYGNNQNIDDIYFDNVNIKINKGEMYGNFIDLRPYYTGKHTTEPIKIFVGNAENVVFRNSNIE